MCRTQQYQWSSKICFFPVDSIVPAEVFVADPKHLHREAVLICEIGEEMAQHIFCKFPPREQFKSKQIFPLQCSICLHKSKNKIENLKFLSAVPLNTEDGNCFQLIVSLLTHKL